MLTYPTIDPIAISLGPLAIRWYGLMYVLAFLQFLFLGRYRLAHHPEWQKNGWDAKALDDLLFYGVLGVILGGRLGQVLFYEPAYYFSNPEKIFAIWEGGMAFHGGFLGVLIAMIFFAKKYRIAWWSLMDFVAPLIPLGLFFGRIGNFINGELWGRVAEARLPWSMVFPHVDPLPRHPSQIYQALGEGLLLFVFLWLFSQKPRPKSAVSAVFLIGYGICRFTAEYFRVPDDGIFGYSTQMSMGQWLSLPMILLGALLFWRTLPKK